jgi:hypothetical protein
MMKVIVVFKRLLASGNAANMAAIYSNGGNWPLEYSWLQFY